MPCATPFDGFVDLDSGAPVFSWHPGRNLKQAYIACGQCVECRRLKASELSLRAWHEFQAMGPRAAGQFLTLTISDEFLPRSDAEWRRMGVLFVKRLRDMLARQGIRVRTFGVRERGEFGDRPHFHLCVFGHAFEVSREWAGVGSSRTAVYRVPELEKLWPFGHVGAGTLTRRSVSYVARYCLKKSTVPKREEGAYASYGGRRVALSPFVLPDGEVVQLAVAEPFARSQGLGRAWCDLYGEQSVREGAVVLPGGQRVPLPGYYLDRVEKSHPDVAEATRELRRELVRVNWREDEPARRAVRVEVSQARSRFSAQGRR